MSRTSRIPDGFVASTGGNATLVADRRHVEALARAGLDRPDGWRRATSAVEHAGRGVASRLELGPGLVARVKQLRRGGWAAPLWGDRFAGTRRAFDNLCLPLEAAGRGLPTPAPLALLVETCCRGFVRAWLAVEEIEGAIDLRERFATDEAPVGEELDAVMRLVRSMHDRGIEHRDLNLGNLLIRPGGEPAAYVIDLDRARLRPGPLGYHARQHALRRLERSYVKTRHPRPARPDVRRSFYLSYSGGDDELRARLERGLAAGRVWIALHRLGWRSK